LLATSFIAHTTLHHLLSNHHCCWEQRNLWQSYEQF